MKFRPPRDGSGDRRGNDAAYRFCSRDNNAREGWEKGGKLEERSRKEGKEKKRGKRKRKKNKSGGRRGETRRVACSRREEGALGAGWACGKKREEYFEVEESDAGTGGGGARGSCRRGLVRRRSQELAGFPR